MNIRTKEITIYISSDGEEHQSKEDAIKRQEIIDHPRRRICPQCNGAGEEQYVERYANRDQEAMTLGMEPNYLYRISSRSCPNCSGKGFQERQIVVPAQEDWV